MVGWLVPASISIQTFYDRQWRMQSNNNRVTSILGYNDDCRLSFASSVHHLSRCFKSLKQEIICDNQIFWFVTISFWFFEKNTMTRFLFWFRSQIKSRILCLQSNQVVHRRQIQYPANCKVTFPISFHRLNHWNWRQDNQWMSLRRKLFFTESWFIFPQTFSPFLAFAVYSRSKGW